MLHLLLTEANIQVILGSGSPRRKELLSSLIPDFKVEVRPTDEKYPEELSPKKIAEYLAVQKIKAFDDAKPNELIICADTTVICKGEVLNKAANIEEAQIMLQKLSGRKHKVVTGLALKFGNTLLSFSDVSNVELAPISSSEIDYYINTYQPFDKAGAYGIQEWIGLAKIMKLKGSYYSIMGLPTHLVYEGVLQLLNTQKNHSL